MRKFLLSLTGVAIAAGVAVPASAQTASVANASTAKVNGSFDRQSIKTTDLQFQYGTLMATGAGMFTFSYLGNESGWVNGFRLDAGGAGVLTEQSVLGSSVTLQVDADHLRPEFTFFTNGLSNSANARNGDSFSDFSNPSFAIISNRHGGNVLANYGGSNHGFQYVLGFNDAYRGDRDFDDYKVGVNFVAAPVPEPSTYALMLAGLGAVGWMARRRRAV